MAVADVINIPLNIFHIKMAKPEQCLRHFYLGPDRGIYYAHCDECGFRAGRFCKYIKYETGRVEGSYPVGPDVTGHGAHTAYFTQWCCATCGEIVQMSRDDLRSELNACKYCGTPHVVINNPLFGDMIMFAVPVDHKMKYKKERC